MRTTAKPAHHAQNNPGRSRAMTGSSPLFPPSDDTVDQQCTEEQRKLDHVIDAVNALHTGHGFLSDEFPTL
ncbi:hypothetical protein GMO_25700 [Gluconobacter morbifer G707]|uniref:Uncharacterized protein n=4 Tax=Acetobacteraceae TaxID=433 RepID=G6XM52_9PROT|nr:hypothetical protein GMO_25700 [Gluconobacter morbifer G707]